MKYPKIGQLFLLLFFIVSCAKEQDFDVTFKSTIAFSEKGVPMINAEIQSDLEIETRGLICSIDSNVAVDSYTSALYSNLYSFRKIIDLTNATFKTYSIEGLHYHTKYYYKLFAVYKGSVKYSNEKSFTTSYGELSTGPAGGPVIFSDGNGGGIEVAIEYVTPSATWGCSNFLLGGTFDEVGKGAANTNKILNDCGIGTLAEYCSNYSQNGFSDYYMPSIDELKLIYDKVYLALGNPFYWSPEVYISSTEANATQCKALQFDGLELTFGKNNAYNYSTIPVRSF